MGFVAPVLAPYQGELNPDTRALLVELRGGFVNRYKSR